MSTDTHKEENSTETLCGPKPGVRELLILTLTQVLTDRKEDIPALATTAWPPQV